MAPYILVPAPPNLVLSPPIWYFQVLSLGFFLFFHRPIAPNGRLIFFPTIVKFLFRITFFWNGRSKKNVRAVIVHQS
jgi:hypothetical protein